MADETLYPASPAADLSTVLIPLLKGVTYRADDAAHWSALLQLQARVRDHVAVLGLELMCDEAEGYAFLRSRTVPEASMTHTAWVRTAQSRPANTLLEVSVFMDKLREVAL